MTDAALDRAVDQGRILRTHVLRPTWHFVTPADIHWMLELTAPHVHKRMSTYDRQFGLDNRIMVKATGIFERVLRDGDFLTRAELGAHLARAGLPGKGSPLAHIALYAELEGVLVSGPRRGKEFTYALLANRVPRARRLSRDQALGELARRFFRSHGPATIRDFVWWSGLRTADAKRGLEIIRAKSEVLEGLQYWRLGSGPRLRSARRRVHLLPIYDEYLVAYRDREAVPHSAFKMGNFWHGLVIDGHVAGTWRTLRKREGLVLQVTPLRPLSSRDRRDLGSAVDRYRRFLELPVSLSIA